MTEEYYWPTPEEVSAVLRSHRKPVGLLVDLVEYEAYYTVRLYRSNFDMLTEPTRVATADWVQKTIEGIRAICPVYLEVWRAPGVPE